MERTNEELTLDGNAVAGLLAEIAGEDVTATFGACPDCGNHAELATMRAYTHGPGVVLRCSVCDGVQLVIVETPRGRRWTVRVKVEGHFPVSR
jgi:hypothetical protein